MGGGDQDTIPAVPRPSTKQLLHGVWQRVTGANFAPYVVYDSVRSVFSEKRDYGFNFRSELASRVRLDSNLIWWGVGDGTYDPWLYLRWSPRYDTLTLSYDSLFRWSYGFVRDSIV